MVNPWIYYININSERVQKQYDDDDIDVYVIKIIILFIIGFIFVTSIYILMHLAVMEDINIPFDLKLNLYLVNTIIYLGLYYPVFKTIQSISNFKTKNKYD